MADVIKGQSFDEERALYGSSGVTVEECRFEGPADGESAFKESRDIKALNCFFDLRYPFWHVTNLKMEGCEMTPLCRASLWYSHHIEITDTRMHGIKAVRECSDISISGCSIISPEFGWFNKDIVMRDTSCESEYFMMRSDRLNFENVKLKGKYSFQYITDSTFENCDFDTKDAFWHARNVTVRNSRIRSEYLAWYCENVTFENCEIIGTQPLCYCKGLKLINCRMTDTDLAFEKSEVDASILTPVISIKNPKNGKIRVPGVGEVIADDPEALGEVIITGEV